MRSLTLIAWNELKSHFVSPIAWVLLITFVLHVSALFIDRVDLYAALQFTRGNQGRALSQIIFTDGRDGVITNLLPYMLLYVPLLTMGVFARDVQNGAIKMLLSSPLSLMSIVLGKYIATVLYFGIFGFALILFILGASLVVENTDHAHLMTAVFGFYLLVCAYASVGVFISSLTSNQVVAAIATLVTLGVLDVLWRVGQGWPVIGEITYWLSMSGRVEYIIQGLITTKDVFYYFLVIGLFLALTYLRFDAGRRAEPRLVLGGRVLLLGAAIAVLGVASSSPSLVAYWDTTRRAQNTLSPTSQSVVSQVDGRVTVTAYINVLDGRARYYREDTRRALVRGLFDPFIRFNPNLEVEFVFYYGPPSNSQLLDNNPGETLEELARDWARDNGVPFNQIRNHAKLDTAIDLSSERFRPLYVFEWGDSLSVVRTFDDPLHHPTEREISHTFYRMTEEPVKLGVFTGSNARSALTPGPTNYRTAVADPNTRNALINSGFSVLEFGSDTDVPEDVSLLILAGPTESLTDKSLNSLVTYFDSGGDLMILADPGSESALAPLLSRLGVEQIEGDIRQTSETSQGVAIQDVTVFANATPEAFTLDLAPMPDEFGNIDRLALETPSAFRFVGSPTDPRFSVSPIFTPMRLATRMDGNEVPEDILFGFIAERILPDGTSQRIYALSDADSFATSMLGRKSMFVDQNRQVFDRAISWITSGTLPLDMSLPAPTDDVLAMSVRQVDQIRLLLFLFVPFSLGVFGFYWLKTRKNA